jgi:hypothetical protein
VAKTVILHLTGEDPVLADIDEDPQPGDQFIKVTNMRKRDGKPGTLSGRWRAGSNLPLAPGDLR